MVTQDLINYIKQELASGKNYDYIIKNLKSVGWQDTDIQEAFKLVGINSNVYQQNGNVQTPSHVNAHQNYNSVEHLNNTQNLNSNLFLPDKVDKIVANNSKSSFGITVVLSIVFIVLSLFLFVASIFAGYLKLTDNIIFYVVSCLVPIFAFIALILSILSLGKNKIVSIINIFLSIIILLIQIISFAIGFVVGFTQSRNISNGDNTNVDSSNPTPTKNISVTTPTQKPDHQGTSTTTPTSTPSPTPYFRTQKEKADFIRITVNQVKKTTQFPVKLSDITTWVDIQATENSVRYIYDVDAASTGSFAMYLDDSFRELVCNNTEVVNEILSKDINIEYLINFKLDSKQRSFIISHSDCY